MGMFGGGVGGGGGGGAPGAQKFTQQIGDGVQITFVINHELNTTEVTVAVKEVASKHVVYPDVYITDANNVTVSVIGAPPALNALEVTIIG